MTDFIDGLEQDLLDAARRRAIALPTHPARHAARRRRRPALRPLLVAAAILVPTAGTAAAGTLLALRGSAIPAPEAVPPEQTPAAGTSSVSALRAADPQAGVPPWTIRVARSQTGLVCSTVGQVRAGQFGLVGLDGRFRTIAEGVSDSCGAEREYAASLIGARVFDAAQRDAVRTVVSGVAGAHLRRVEVQAAGRTLRVPVVAGAFATALRGYPEDLAIRATLSFASGRREVHDFGGSRSVVVDPAGGPAWRTMALMTTDDARTCTSFSWARSWRDGPMSPSACGDLGQGRHRHGWFFKVQRLAPGTNGRDDGERFDFARGRWGHHAARTAVWGGVGEEVRAISVQVGTARPRPVTIPPSRAFLAVFDPGVDPATLIVRLRLAGGRIVTAHGDANIVARRIPRKVQPAPQLARPPRRTP
jgi:hypothetical protein